MRTVRDISGMKMEDVVCEICAYPLEDTAGKFAAWRPDPVVHAARLAGTFPVGSQLRHYTDSSGRADLRGGVQSLQASFTSGNGVKYWLCLRRVSVGSPRNCEAAGAGSYRIETRGDARVLRFANPPARAASLGYVRIMVERDGQI